MQGVGTVINPHFRDEEIEALRVYAQALKLDLLRGKQILLPAEPPGKSDGRGRLPVTVAVDI